MSIDVRRDRFIVDGRGRPMAVILSFLDYQKLIHLAEDRDDTRTLQHAIRTSRGTLSHAELLTRLKRQRLL